MNIEQRQQIAATVQELLGDKLQEKGLSISGFQYPLVGEMKYQIEVDCFGSKELGYCYETVKQYTDSTKARIISANVAIDVSGCQRAVIVCAPYGSKA